MPKNNKQQPSAVQLEALLIAVGKVIKRQALQAHKEIDMSQLDRELVRRFKQMYLQMCGEKLSDSEAERNLIVIAVVLRAIKIKQSARKNGK